MRVAIRVCASQSSTRGEAARDGPQDQGWLARLGGIVDYFVGYGNVCESGFADLPGAPAISVTDASRPTRSRRSIRPGPATAFTARMPPHPRTARHPIDVALIATAAAGLSATGRWGVGVAGARGVPERASPSRAALRRAATRGPVRVRTDPYLIVLVEQFEPHLTNWQRMPARKR
jgi:hypothetical protein